MNILYFANPNSIHNLKWMGFFTKQHSCFLLMRKADEVVFLKNKSFAEFEQQAEIKVLGALEDFSVRHFIRSWNSFKQLKKIVADYNITHLHVLYAEPNALWAYWGKQLKIPIILTTRGTDVLKTIPRFLEGRSILQRIVSHLYCRSFRNFTAITCTSSRQKAAVRRILKGKEVPIEVIRTGVDVEKVLQDTSEHQHSQVEGKRFVFFPRAMYPLYNHELALEAINQLGKTLIEQYHFVFIDKNTRDQSYAAKIQALMDESPARIIWLDKLDQLSLFQMYKDATLIVMTPLSDGTPVTAIEAMLTKHPLILPPLEYDEDLFSEGICQFKDWTASALAEAMTTILENKIELDVELAYKKAIALGNRAVEMKKLEQLYLQYANEKSK